MKIDLVNLPALVLVMLFAAPSGYAGAPVDAPAVDVSAKDWQIKSLKGVAAINYGVAYDPSKRLTTSVTSLLAGVKVPMKSVNLKEERAKTLSKDEARLKVVVDQREKDKTWVGLSLEQKSQLSRDPAVSFDAETYKIGRICSAAEIDSTLKELCERFVKDFSSQSTDKK